MNDLDRQIAQLKRCEYLKESEVKALCARARDILIDESNVQRVDAPVTVRARCFLRHTAHYRYRSRRNARRNNIGCLICEAEAGTVLVRLNR